jgi:hypothetical protein
MKTLWRWLLAAAALSSSAQADPLGETLIQRFGSNKANVKNLKELYDRDVRGEVSLGLWYANLSGGVSSLAQSWGTAGGDETPVDTATRSIGRGSGVVREVRLGLSVAGNEAFFDYLSDELVETAQEESSKRVSNETARRVIRQLIGELRPDLKSILGPEARVWVRGEYGKFQGAIENANVFASRNGRPYFGSRSEGWDTSYFGFELGVAPTGPEPMNRYDKSSFNHLTGIYARYRNFSRPMALGFSPEKADARFILQDGTVTLVDLGIRTQLARCQTFCVELEGAFSPFTGFMHIGLGPLGSLSGTSVALSGNLRLSYPIKLWGDHFLAPYAGFRTESIIPIVGLFKSDDYDFDSTEYRERPTVWPFDYFFWGPTVGLTGRI